MAKKVDKTPKNTLKMDGVDFNLDHAATLTEDQFLHEQANQYPLKTEDARKACLLSVFKKAIEAGKKLIHANNDNGHAGTVQSAIPGGSVGGSGGVGSDSGDEPNPVSTAQSGNQGDGGAA